MVAKHFEHPRIREAFSFHSMFIGGDPFRVPAIYAALVYLQFLDERLVRDAAASTASSRRWPRALDVRCGARVERIEHRAGAVRRRRARGRRADRGRLVVSNADVLRTHELLGMRGPHPAPAPDDVVLPAVPRHRPALRGAASITRCSSAAGTGASSADVTRRGRLPETYSTYLHVPSRTEPAMAAPGGDSICVLLPVPNLRAGVDWAAQGDGVRDALVEDLETTFGLRGPGRRHRRRAPHGRRDDFASELGAVDGNAFAVEPTLHQSAWLRQHNRDRRVRGLYHVGGGTHPGAGIPGVLLGAEVTAGLIAADHPRPAGTTRRAHAARAR